MYKRSNHHRRRRHVYRDEDDATVSRYPAHSGREV